MKTIESTPEAPPSYPLADIGANNLLLNRWAKAEYVGEDPLHHPPSRNPWYYGRYPWDSDFIQIVLARSGLPSHIAASETEAKTLYDHQQDSGIIFNRVGIESFRKHEPENKYHKEYGQAPLGAIAAVERHHAVEHQPGANPNEAQAEALTRSLSLYPNIAKQTMYWAVERSTGPGNHLVGVIRAEETGMDESPLFDPVYEQLDLPFQRIKREGINTPWHVDARNTLYHFASRMAVAKKMKDAGEDIERAREIFWMNPVQMQCLVVANCYANSDLATALGKPEDALIFSKLGKEIEDQVLSDIGNQDKPGMWDGQARNGRGMFRDLDRNGQPITATDKNSQPYEEVTASNIMPILLPNIEEHQLDSVLDLAFEELVAEFGMSTVGRSSPNYDPGYGEKETGRWRTQGWMNMLWLVAEGCSVQMARPDLSMQVKAKSGRLFNHILESSKNLIEKWDAEKTPLPEYWNPITGKALRLYRVQWFGWTNLAYSMPGRAAPSAFAKSLLRNSEPEKGRELMAA